MKIGIIGLPQSGKKTLFRLLTGVEARQTEDKSLQGTASIRDPRFDSLVKMYSPRKATPAQIIMELMPDLDRRVIQEGAVFRDIAGLDALCLVIRTFEDESVYHVRGSVNPARDLDEINSEFLLHDLLFIEKRMERLAAGHKKGMAEQNRKEEALLGRLREHLEGDRSLRTCGISPEDEKIIASYPFLTRKALLAVLNCGETDTARIETVRDMEERYSLHRIRFIAVPARLESEIDALESEEERLEFMKESGIDEPAINLLSRMAMESLGLISFFTVGSDEVRQWLIRKDCPAPEAAGVIHSDIQRGFIRAEVIRYDELMKMGSEEKLKQSGMHYIMGRDYVVDDGAIISFRFNV